MSQELPADVPSGSIRSRTGLWPAWIALACALSLTLLAWRYAEQDLEREQRREFDAEVSQVRADLKARLAGYTQILRSAAALFAASDKVSRQDWRSYVAALKLERDYPAIQAMAFARSVGAAELPALVDEMRGSGMADFVVRPPGGRDHFVVNVFAEPYNGQNRKALGYDMWQDAERRETMQRARDSGAPTITPRLTLKIDEQDNPVPAFIMYLPVMSRSGSEVFGYVLSPFRMPNLVSDVMRQSHGAVSLSIHDGTEVRPESLFYRGAVADPAVPPKFVHGELLVVGGRTWTLSFASQPKRAELGYVTRSAQVLAGGLLTSALLFAIAWSLATTRDRALRLARDMTRSLRESEDRFRVMVEQAPDAITVYDVDQGRFVDANAQAERLFGCSREELMAGGVDRFYAPGVFDGRTAAEYVQDMVARAMAGDQIVFDRTLRNAQGQLVRCEMSLVRLPAVDKRLIRVSFIDITERKRMEAALRESEERYRTLIEWSPEPIGVHRRGKIIYVNPAAIAMLGAKSAEELIGKPILDLVHPDYHQIVLERVKTAADRDGAAPMLEEKFLKLDGTLIDVEVKNTSINFDGEPAIQVAMRDVTERKRAEADLRVAAITFESQEGVIITDHDNVILRVNRAFTEITGYSSADAVGKTPNLLRSGRHDAAFFAAMWESLEREGTWRGEIWNRRKSGEIYPGWLNITAVTGGRGTVTHYVATFADITLRKAAEDEIRHLAFYDALTGLPNRRLMLERLGQALISSGRHGRHGALMLFDLDDFKTLNDTLGHDIGDQFLVEVASRLASSIREGDTVARLGGDEFVIILEDLDAEALAAMQAESVAVKIQAALNEPYLLDLSLSGGEHNSRSYHCTSSIGITLFRDQSVSVDELLKRADTAMYQAKAAGRNTLRFFDPEMQAAVTARALLDTDLRRALGEGQFMLHYQPQVDTDGRVTGAEALVRWQHPRRGLVFPAEFIHQAEATRLIMPLGNWVLETACKQLVAWETQADTAHLTVAVNVSGRQFYQTDFVDQVLAVLQLTGANPRRLKLEVTESLLLHDIEDIVGKMAALKDEGVSFSLDDFGTGYSSLSYLKRLPLDQLKIDQSFVRDVLTDGNDAAISRTIIALGQSLGLAVIAEGVETQAQFEFLANQGCHAFQGNLFGKPGAAEDLLKGSTAEV
ncbi:MAG: EAL domain-containing protein [Sulfuritalea sp.]|nr:EAL domain-containing protein [Sulfuritalea sp.]